MSIQTNNFDYIRALVRRESGIVLEASKLYLVEARLEPIANARGDRSLDAFVMAVRGDRKLQAQVVDAMTTNETSFFRDRHPFETIRSTVLPKLMESRQRDRRLHIWSAACSSGQEVYSLAMMLEDHFPELNTWKVDIVATDISDQMLEKAKTGRYSRLEISRGMPAAQLGKHFDLEGSYYQAKRHLKRRLTFLKQNLHTGWLHAERSDLVLIRNVLIYFEERDKVRILEKAHRQLRPGGYLMLGASEALPNLKVEFERVAVGRTQLYRRPERSSNVFTNR